MSRRAPWAQGWWRGAQRCCSPNQGPRPEGVAVDLVVLHSISLPPGQYGGAQVQALFTNTLDVDSHPSLAGLRGLQVSAHFFVRRNGHCMQFVACERRAWHAGVSQWQGRENCNDYSIGIELEGLEGQRFTPAQYRALRRLLAGLRRRYPVRAVQGHEHIAAGRKGDPGAGFDWARLRRGLGAASWQWPAAAWPPRDQKKQRPFAENGKRL